MKEERKSSGASERKSALCGVCPGGCGIMATLKDGRLVKVEPDRSVPYGNLCIRGKAGPEIVYSQDRLKMPLIRTGERGEGRFRTATWDEALDLVAERMKKIRETYGAQAFVYHSGTGRLRAVDGRFRRHLPLPFRLAQHGERRLSLLQFFRGARACSDFRG